MFIRHRGSVVLDHAVIGEGAIVAAGSVVLSKTIVEPGSIYAGVPAKFVKKVDPEQAKEINQKIAKNYHMYSSWYKEEHRPTITGQDKQYNCK